MHHEHRDLQYDFITTFSYGSTASRHSKHELCKSNCFLFSNISIEKSVAGLKKLPAVQSAQIWDSGLSSRLGNLFEGIFKTDGEAKTF